MKTRAAPQAVRSSHYRALLLETRSNAYAVLRQPDSAAAAARELGDLFAFGSEEQLAWSRAPLLMARHAAARGDTVAARAAYARFAGRWTAGDADLAELAEARRALGRLAVRRPDGPASRDLVVR